MDRTKLEKLANELSTEVQDQYEKHGLEKWNMDHWFSIQRDPRHSLHSLVDSPEPDAIKRQQIGLRESGCGTAACAGGWATAFFDELIINDCGHIEYDGHENRSALCAFFGITTAEADDLFMTENYPDDGWDCIEPIDVAEKIRYLMSLDPND